MVAGWRAIFGCLVVVGLLTMAAVFTLTETLSPTSRSPEPLRRAFADYGHLLTDRRLLSHPGAGGFFFLGTSGYIAATPFAYITVHHVPPQLYGFLFGAGIVGIMLISTFNARFVTSLGSYRLLLWGATIATLASILLVIASYKGWGGLAGLAVPMFAFVAATGLIAANAIAGALAGHPKQAGAVSALFGAIQYGGGILGSALVGLLADGTARPMGLVVAVGGVGTLLCARIASRPKLHNVQHF